MIYSLFHYESFESCFIELRQCFEWIFNWEATMRIVVNVLVKNDLPWSWKSCFPMFKSTGQEEGIVSFMSFMLIFVLPRERREKGARMKALWTFYLCDFLNSAMFYGRKAMVKSIRKRCRLIKMLHEIWKKLCIKRVYCEDIPKMRAESVVSFSYKSWD
jgi:hypothetical protein